MTSQLAALAYIELYWAVLVVQEIQVLKSGRVARVVEVLQVIQVLRMISLDDMHSENVFFSGFKPPNYRGKLRCHACDGGMRRRKVGKSSILVDQKPQKQTIEI